MTPLKAGDIAPKFSLPDQDGEEVNLTDFQGQRVLVYFYPKAMTPGCTTQACDFSESLEDLKEAGTEVVGISPDDPEKLASDLDALTRALQGLSDDLRRGAAESREGQVDR